MTPGIMAAPTQGLAVNTPIRTSNSPNETVGARKPQRRQRKQAEEKHIRRQIFAKTHVIDDFPAVAAFVNGADQHKQGACGDAVIQHDHERALKSSLGKT